MRGRHTIGWCAVVALTATTYACGGSNDAVSDAGSEIADAAESVGEAAERAADAVVDGAAAVADIIGKPESYYGREVTIEGVVDRVLGPEAFSVDEAEPVDSGVDNDILILSREAASPQGLDDTWIDDRVRITGTIGRVDIAEIEREIGRDLTPEVEAQFKGERAVLIAASVTRVSQQ